MSEKEQWHSRVVENKAGVMALLTTVAISVGGLIEIIPMYTVAANSPDAAIVAAYTPLEVAGRDIYVREGCYNCHSQMVRPMLAETMRYGEWSRAAEYVHDRPFQLGSRRIGPDVARVGGKYPDAWHYNHMLDPRATSPGSIMPPYPWLYTDMVDPDDVAASLRALGIVGGEYDQAAIDGTADALSVQAAGIVDNLANAGIEANPDAEIIALIAYLQRLGTDIDELVALEQQAL